MSQATLELFLRAEFMDALRVGLAALVVGGLVGLLWPGEAPAPAGGLAAAGAALLALWETGGLPGEVLVGTGLLALGGLVTALPGPRLAAGMAAAIPGAWVVTVRVGLPGETWMTWLALATVVLGAPLVAAFDRRHRSSAATLPLLVLSVVGILFTVPDTEQALVLLGATAPLALLAWPWPLASLGGPGAFAVLGPIAWVTVSGGYGRGGAVVGAVACLGLLVAEPLGRLLTRTRETVVDGLLRTGTEGLLVVGSAQLVTVFLVSRVAGVRREPLEAALIVAGVLTAAAVLSGVRAAQARSSVQ